MANSDREFLIALLAEAIWKRTSALSFAAETSHVELMDMSGQSLMAQMDTVRDHIRMAASALASGNRQPVLDLQDEVITLGAEVIFLLLALNQVTATIEEPDLDL